MDMTFKFRFVNEITGVFVLLALALLVGGIFMAGHAQGLFEKKFKLHVVFTSTEGSFGLKKGSEIKILANPAGTVEEIEPTSDGAIKAVFVIKERYHGFVRTSSHAIVKKTLVITGDAYVEISVGNRKDPLIPGGNMIDCVKDTEIIEQAKAMLDETKNTMAEIKAAIIPTLQSVQQELPPLMIQVRKTLQQGEVLMRDDLPGLTTQTQDTLMELQILIRGIQRHWLFRKYIENPENGPLISPASLALPVGEPTSDPVKQTGGESK